MLPLDLAPPAPFPLVTRSLTTTEFVAPGITRTEYALATSAGPLVVHVVRAEMREPTLRIETVLAHDRLVSAGETVSGMALRTHAVAGVNADYFDIGATNQPLNAVIRGGVLVRTPSTRAVLWVTSDGAAHFGKMTFAGTVSYGTTHVPLTTIGQWPPEGGAALIGPAFGRAAASAAVTALTLAPQAAIAADGFSGAYRVLGAAPATAGVPAGPTLGWGPAAFALAPPPAVGDVVTLAGDTDPPLAGMRTAVGGGPLLIGDGSALTDPQAPAPEETGRRFPVSGAATAPDGALLLIAVDGRRPALSVGLTRPEFGALMLGLGATDGMAFDSGGSAELVARVLGDRDASVVNAPSDGRERRVADGLFLASDAPQGPASRLVVRPSAVHALPGARVTLSAAAVDAAGHARGAVALAGGPAIVAPLVAGTQHLTLRSGALRSDLTIETVARLADLRIDPARIVVEPGATASLTARGLDERGRDVALGTMLAWQADRGAIDAAGTFRAGSRDANVIARAGGRVATAHVFVGRHELVVQPYGSPAWTFATAPRAGTGSAIVRDGSLRLTYDLRGGGRAAYANVTLPLPGEPERFAVDVDGDGSGAGLRAAFSNRFGERQALTLAPRIDWTGVRRLMVELPPDLNPPVTLLSLYVTRPLAGGDAVEPHGALRFGTMTLTLPGTP